MCNGGTWSKCEEWVEVKYKQDKTATGYRFVKENVQDTIKNNREI